MGRGPTNENTNMYFQARKKAATYNERLWSREGAAELLGMCSMLTGLAEADCMNWGMLQRTVILNWMQTALILSAQRRHGIC